MRFRPVEAQIDLAAIAANVAALSDLAGDASLMAVVKADAYGHGAVEVAKTATRAGAEWLGVALVEEGVELREAGIDGPILVLSEPPVVAAEAVVAARLTPTVYGEQWIGALAEAVAASGSSSSLPVHLKVDTGMHRAGCDAGDALAIAKAVVSHGELVLEGVMTHFAVADEVDHPATDEQIAGFTTVLAELAAAGITPDVVHAANSAAAMTRPEARYDLVRCGIALYGIAPAPELEGRVELAPAMSLAAQVSHVRRVDGGEGVSYGLRYRLERPGTIATVPIGYADGVPRRLGHVGGEVLVGGRRRPIAGTVTMDQIMVDCGDDEVSPGDDVVLIGRQGDEEITASEWAVRLDTIAYEITCGIGARVPRRYRP